MKKILDYDMSVFVWIRKGVDFESNKFYRLGTKLVEMGFKNVFMKYHILFLLRLLTSA